MFYQPVSIEEALELKSRLLERARFVAGGTDLVVLLNHGSPAPGHIIDLSRIRALRKIRRRDGSIEAGSCVTFQQCIHLPVECLAAAAASVGGPGIREMGTLGGNLATASPAGDGSTALLSLDAELELASAGSKRRIAVDKFFLDYRRTDLGDHEMIRSIRFPAAKRSRWAKVGKRGAVNISIVAASAAMATDGKVRLALASVAPTPMRCYRTEDFLDRHGLRLETIEEAASIARSEVRPITDHRASAEYKRHLTGVLVRRLLEGFVSS